MRLDNDFIICIINGGSYLLCKALRSESNDVVQNVGQLSCLIGVSR